MEGTAVARRCTDPAMDRISQPLTVESRLAWALLWIAVVIFLGALLWGMLNPHFHTMTDTGQRITNETAGQSEAAQTGFQRVALVWKLWPLWFSVGLIYYGWNRALSESKRTPK